MTSLYLTNLPFIPLSLEILQFLIYEGMKNENLETKAFLFSILQSFPEPT